MLDALTLAPWQRTVLESRGIDPDGVQQLMTPDLPVKLHGDPTLGGNGLRMAIDANCPHCGWPERFYDTTTRHFGCIKCTYVSDERNA
jgi:hypothetical protein